MARQTKSELINALRYIETITNETGYPPSVRQIGEHMGVSSPSTAHSIVKQLQRRGFLTSTEGHVRSWVLTSLGKHFIHSDAAASPQTSAAQSSHPTHPNADDSQGHTPNNQNEPHTTHTTSTPATDADPTSDKTNQSTSHDTPPTKPTPPKAARHQANQARWTRYITPLPALTTPNEPQTLLRWDNNTQQFVTVNPNKK